MTAAPGVRIIVADEDVAGSHDIEDGYAGSFLGESETRCSSDARTAVRHQNHAVHGLHASSPELLELSRRKGARLACHRRS